RKTRNLCATSRCGRSSRPLDSPEPTGERSRPAWIVLLSVVEGITANGIHVDYRPDVRTGETLGYGGRRPGDVEGIDALIDSGDALETIIVMNLISSSEESSVGNVVVVKAAVTRIVDGDVAEVDSAIFFNTPEGLNGDGDTIQFLGIG
ncbi:hypothetical protein FOZ63_032375, partial [Perkinsus olseni]